MLILIPVGELVVTFVRSGDAVIGACRAANKVVSLISVVLVVANGLLVSLAILFLVFLVSFLSLFLCAMA